MNRKVDLGDPLPLPYQTNTKVASTTSFDTIKPIKLERKPYQPRKLRNRIILDIRLEPDEIRENYQDIVNDIKNLVVKLNHEPFQSNVSCILQQLEEISSKFDIDNSKIHHIELAMQSKQKQLLHWKDEIANEDFDINNSDYDMKLNSKNLFDEIDRLKKLKKSKLYSKILIIVFSILIMMISGLLVSDLKYDYCYYIC